MLQMNRYRLSRSEARSKGSGVYCIGHKMRSRSAYNRSRGPEIDGVYAVYPERDMVMDQFACTTDVATAAQDRPRLVNFTSEPVLSKRTQNPFDLRYALSLREC